MEHLDGMISLAEMMGMYPQSLHFNVPHMLAITVTGVDPITIRQSLIPSSLRPLSSQSKVEWKEERELECIDSATGQETQLAILGTTGRVLYTVQSIRNVLHYDALQKEPESYGSVKKLRETGEMHRPELDGTRWKRVEYAGNYSIVQRPGLG